ncbi:GM20303 [Drosophila sechellia]|uniref:GM20303 n=1 Tax=Drosophila sechellia TaxID=7238 RepID=B4HQ22_DROSE|nr:GM20303 [Drosophila sechellia]
MGIPTIKKCCCLELKWGALIAVVVDWLFAGAILGQTMYFKDHDGGMNIVWFVVALVHIAHIVCIILVLVSLCVPNKKLVAPYLITAIIRVIIDIILFIFACIKLGDRDILGLVLIIIGIILAVILWIVVFSWYKKLGGSADI